MTAPLTSIAVIDTETTGFPPDATMCQVARTDLRLYPGGWEIEIGPREEFVDPGRPIPAAVSAIHHIVDADCVGAMSQDEAVRFATVGADIVAAHHWDFDRQFVRTSLPFICTLKVARSVWPDLESHANQAIRYARGICMSAEERMQAAHRAGFDTWITAHILLDLLNAMPVEQMLDISSKPSRLLRFPGGNKHRGKLFSEIARYDPSYLRWVIDKSEFGEDVKFSSEAALREAS